MVSMSSEDISMNHFASANVLLDAAEIYLAEGNNDLAISSVEEAVNLLTSSGVSILLDIPESDIAELDGRLASVLRRFGEEAGILPENFATVLSLSGISLSLDGEFAEKMSSTLSASEIVEVLEILYTSSDEISPDPEKDLSVLNILAGLLTGQKTVSEMVFAENGAYDMLSLEAAPYLITGAAYVYGDEEEYEKKIPEMLDGPVKRLVCLMFSLMTSTFMSGLLLLLIRRILTTRKTNPGIVDNTVFAASVLSLIVANIPIFIEGLREVSHELDELRNMIITS